jgi:predicted nucleotidyltransferase
MPPALHVAARAEAQRLSVSLNEYVVRCVSSRAGGLPDPMTALTRRALVQFSDALVGVIAFGSWARGELADTSDIDVLIVLDRSIPLTRSLYRSWDRDELRVGPHRVEAHFVHLAPDDEPPSALWAEVAIDGIIVLDSGMAIARLLAAVRRHIANGTLVRRRSHGQPYWVSAA